VLDESGELRRFVNVFVRDEDVRFQEGLDTKLGTTTSSRSSRRSPAARSDAAVAVSRARTARGDAGGAE
jgi:hypothetical protein